MTTEVLRPQPTPAAAPAQAQPAAPMVQPQYIEGFEGAGAKPFSSEIRSVLREPVNPALVEIRPDGIVYLPGVFYRQVLTRAFGEGGWAMAPRGPIRTRPAARGGELVAYHGALICHGRFVAEAIGQCIYWPSNTGMTYADAAEGAKTDCITRCSKDLFIAHELWEPQWREKWQAEHATKERDGKWKRLPNSSTPPTAPTSPAPIAGTATAAPPAAPGLSTTAAPELPPAANVDDGIAADESELAKLNDLVFQQLKWKKQFAAQWIRARFGVGSKDLTLAQLTTAFSLLYAWARGADLYAVELGAHVAEGRCLP